MKLHLRTKELLYWIKERHQIYLKRCAGKPKPWSKDPVFQQYRFCNVYRELDVVTCTIRDRWRTPYADDPDLWFAMYVARVFNKPATLQAIGWPLPWPAKRAKVEATLAAVRAANLRIFNNAYVVSTHGKKADKIQFYLALFDALWKVRKEVRPKPGDTLRTFYERLTAQNGVASFMAGQIIADTKYAAPLSAATDWWTFAASGPGSKRGLNWIYGREFKKAWQEDAWYEALMNLKPSVDVFIAAQGMPSMHAQDLNNALCETGKMVKVQQGWGRPKSKYDGGA